MSAVTNPSAIRASMGIPCPFSTAVTLCLIRDEPRRASVNPQWGVSLMTND